MRLFMNLVVLGFGFVLSGGARAEVMPKQDQAHCCPTCQDEVSKNCRSQEAVLKNAKVMPAKPAASKTEKAEN